MIEPRRHIYMLLLSDGVSEHFNNQKWFHMFTFSHVSNTVGEGSVGTSGPWSVMLLFSVFD